MNNTVKRFNNLENISVCMLLIDLVVGLLLFKFASLSLKINSVIFGGLLVVHGLFSFIKYFYDGTGSKIFSTQLVEGVVGIIIGIFMCFYKLNSMKLIGVLVGIWFVFNGLVKLWSGINLFRKKEEIAPLVVFTSLLVIVMGVLSIFNPFKDYISVIKLLSIFMVAYVVLHGMLCFLFKKRAKVLLSMFR